MNRRWIIFGFLGMALLTACAEEVPLNPAVSQPTLLPAPPSVVLPTGVPTAAPTASKATAPTSAAPTAVAPTATSAPAFALTCPRAELAPNARLAARVNGVGVSYDLYDRQIQQAQSAMVQQGLDIKTQAGQDALKSLKQQVLDQMINDVVVALEADKRGIKVTDNDLNTRLAQMIQDAGSVDKLNAYLKEHQQTLAEFCAQLRSQILGEAMFNNITAAFPLTAEQVHVRHILVSTPALAQSLRDQLRRGGDFAALAKQSSMDEATKSNGGDLGWVPRDVLAPEVDAIIFQLPVGQISDVVTTFYGFEVYQVTEKEKARALPLEIVQSQKQNAFLAWLNAKRGEMQIERLVQP